MFIGYEIGRYVTPDWDCVTATEDESKMMNQLPIIGNFLFGISSTYGAFFKRKHRHAITHFPFYSTIIRYLLLFWWPWFEIYRSHNQDWAWLIFIFIGMFFGTSLSDLVHFLLDKYYNPTGE